MKLPKNLYQAKDTVNNNLHLNSTFHSGESPRILLSMGENSLVNNIFSPLYTKEELKGKMGVKKSI